MNRLTTRLCIVSIYLFSKVPILCSTAVIGVHETPINGHATGHHREKVNSYIALTKERELLFAMQSDIPRQPRGGGSMRGKRKMPSEKRHSMKGKPGGMALRSIRAKTEKKKDERRLNSRGGYRPMNTW